MTTGQGGRYRASPVLVLTDAIPREASFVDTKIMVRRYSTLGVALAAQPCFAPRLGVFPAGPVPPQEVLKARRDALLEALAGSPRAIASFGRTQGGTTGAQDSDYREKR